MTSQTTLLVIDKDTDDQVITEAAEAAFANASHLACFILGTTPSLPVVTYGAVPYAGAVGAEEWSAQLLEAQKTIQLRTDQVEALLKRSGVSGEVQPAISATTEMKHLVGRRAMTCDLACIAANLRDTDDVFDQVVQGVLFQSPIGLVLNTVSVSNPQHIFLAWDGGMAASRAAHVAMPMLKAASKVTIGCFDLPSTRSQAGEDPGVDVASWLSHHGCAVTVTQYPSGGQDIGTCIQQRAAEIGADLIVMGAYGHSRLRETVFGGTTRTMLKQTDMPVFLAH